MVSKVRMGLGDERNAERASSYEWIAKDGRRMAIVARTPWWTWVWPVLAWVILALTMVAHGATIVIAAAGVILIPTVFAAVHHAEVIAHRIGEPFGSLVLAIAVTVIEVALIVSVMIGAGADKAELPRDTVFAEVMLATNGIVGLCLLLGGARHHVQGFKVEGASAALAVLAALTILTLIVPDVTTSAPGHMLSRPQLVFDGAVSLVLYSAFVFVQTVRHRDYFLPGESRDEQDHARPTTLATALTSAMLLLVALVAVVGLAESLTPVLDSAVVEAGVSKVVVGIVIAMLVLMPEGLAALRAARANRLQTSLNLAPTSLACIGLTIPTVVLVSVVLGWPLELGLDVKGAVLLGLSLFIGVITLGTGSTTMLQGIVHLVILAVFIFLAVVP